MCAPICIYLLQFRCHLLLNWHKSAWDSFVGDSKRAMDEYTSSIFMGGTNTLVIHAQDIAPDVEFVTV